MKKLLFIRFALPLAGGLSLVLFAPVSAIAAAVTLTEATTVVLPLDGLSYTLSSGGTFEELDISGGVMTFSMVSGETVTITAPGSQVLNNNGGFSYACATQSTLTLTPTGTGSIAVTPSGTCVPTTSAGSGSTGSGSSGGSSSSSGGSVATVSTTPTTTTTASTTPAAVTTTTTTTTTTPSTPAKPWVPVNGLTEVQVTSILNVLKSFNADQSVIDKVDAALHGQSSSNASSAATTGAPAFSKDLWMGATGADVKALQQYLNTHGYQITASGAGSPGYETTKFGALTKAALIKLQKAVGLTPPAGYFGAKTRAYIAAHP
ncbi:MAG: peptidoglycan-binding domain-containing protein [bacterium]|nr:peptidoglycan-binding domain-containing protein [bacterium]